MSALPKYKYLLTYRLSEILHDLTVIFCQQYVLGSLSNLSNLGHLQSKPDYRTADQMIQAARSTKQNIVEGVGQSNTSRKGEIKLLGVAYGSVEELKMDLEDFLRQHKLSIYPKDHPKVQEFRTILSHLSHLSNLGNVGDLKERPVLPDNPTDAGNFLLTATHMTSYLLSRQIKAMEEKFVNEGGFTENLFQKRLVHRSPK